MLDIATISFARAVVGPRDRETIIAVPIDGLCSRGRADREHAHANAWMSPDVKRSKKCHVVAGNRSGNPFVELRFAMPMYMAQGRVQSLPYSRP